MQIYSLHNVCFDPFKILILDEKQDYGSVIIPLGL